MAFSASPLVPGQVDTGTDAWRAAAELVTTAVTAALPQIPSASPLTLGSVVADPAEVSLPDPAGAAITAYVGGGAEGKILLVVGQDLVDALSGTPFGDLEPAQALRPALDAVADKLHGRVDGNPTQIATEDCFEVLAGGTTVLVPLLADGTTRALIGVSLTSAVPIGGGRKNAATAASAARSWGIDMLRDVEMEVTCELGRTRMTVRQLLALAPGDVVELDRLAGSPADLLVNGTLLARGEVVVVDESFGLRITEIVTPDAS